MPVKLWRVKLIPALSLSAADISGAYNSVEAVHPLLYVFREIALNGSNKSDRMPWSAPFIGKLQMLSPLCVARLSYKCLLRLLEELESMCETVTHDWGSV